MTGSLLNNIATKVERVTIHSSCFETSGCQGDTPYEINIHTLQSMFSGAPIKQFTIHLPTRNQLDFLSASTAITELTKNLLQEHPSSAFLFEATSDSDLEGLNSVFQMGSGYGLSGEVKLSFKKTPNHSNAPSANAFMQLSHQIDLLQLPGLTIQGFGNLNMGEGTEPGLWTEEWRDTHCSAFRKDHAMWFWHGIAGNHGEGTTWERVLQKNLNYCYRGEGDPPKLIFTEADEDEEECATCAEWNDKANVHKE